MKPFKIWGNSALKKVCLFLLQKITVNLMLLYKGEKIMKLILSFPKYKKTNKYKLEIFLFV